MKVVTGRASSREFPGREFPGNLPILASRFPGKNPRDPGILSPLGKAYFDHNEQEIQVTTVVKVCALAYKGSNCLKTNGDVPIVLLLLSLVMPCRTLH